MTYGHQSCQPSNATATDEFDLGDLTEVERDALAADRERWKHMAQGRHLDDWLGYGPSLMSLRHLAMKAVHVNKPEGRGYTEAFGRLLNQYFPSMDKTSISALLWLHDDAERLMKSVTL